MHTPTVLERFTPDPEALTRSELVRDYERCERKAERTRTSRKDWVDRIPLEDGRIEVRRYEAGRLVAREWVMPRAEIGSRLGAATYATRLA